MRHYLCDLKLHNMVLNWEDIGYNGYIFWTDIFHSNRTFLDKYEGNLLIVPMDSRTYASITGPDDYVFNAIGGNSWTCPWLAGLYALCLQVNPQLTIDEFVHLALTTGDSLIIEQSGNSEQLNTLINPTNLIEAVKK